MLHHPSYEKLAELKLIGMQPALSEQAQRDDISQIPFMDRVALLLDREVMARGDRQLTTRLSRAKLSYPEACLEDLDRRGGRVLSPGLIEQLSNPHDSLGRIQPADFRRQITGEVSTLKLHNLAEFLRCNFDGSELFLFLRYNRTSYRDGRFHFGICGI